MTYRNDDYEEELENNLEEDVKLEPGLIFTRLTDVVRKHYFAYLEKQLWENVRAWHAKNNGREADEKSMQMLLEHIQTCTKVLEDKAIAACQMSQLYQRNMVKIIATVRHSTHECRLENNLQKIITANEKNNNNTNRATKATQTKSSTQTTSHQQSVKTITPPENVKANDVDEFTTLSLQEKIDMFQQRLNQENAARVLESKKMNLANYEYEKKMNQHHQRQHKRRKCSYTDTVRVGEPPHFERPLTPPSMSRSPTPITPAPVAEATVAETCTNVAPTVDASVSVTSANSFTNDDADDEHDDLIAKELALLFSEEKTELDEILGVDPNDEPDDPQISCILKEIENAKLPHELTSTSIIQTVEKVQTPSIINTKSSTIGCHSPEENKLVTIVAPDATPASPSTSKQLQNQNAIKEKDLRNSLWPCELYHQRRLLTESLNRLIEEDFRWHELIKWKFTMLFGEDSDDEFAACSPSIDLDEILIGSCIKRISPWMVKHLMKPMREGLIANRYLFKKLARKLAHSIIMENQYPDERIIKQAVEEFFCIHQAVVTVEDLEDIPNI